MNALRTFVLAAAVVALLAGTWTASADPTPQPSPAYQMPGEDGPELPGVQVYPPWCLRNIVACGFKYDIDTGTWQHP
jgi:hypothetical protein